ncbi:MAG: hypothetical protein ACR2NM_12605, partial [Bythopirellula sp.]
MQADKGVSLRVLLLFHDRHSAYRCPPRVAMNLHPKVRPFWQRALIVPALFLLMAYKALRLPKKPLPRAVRSIVTHWDYSM